MANHVTQAERDKINARARELIDQESANIPDKLVQEFGISRERARTAWGHSVRRKRGEEVRQRGEGRPPKYGETMEAVPLRLPPELIQKIRVRAWESNKSISETIQEILQGAIDSKN